MKKILQLFTLLLIAIGFTSTTFAQGVDLNVPIPGVGGGGTLTGVSDIGPYVNAIFTFGTGFVISLSIVMVMIAGVRWLTSAGNPTRIGTAKSDIITYIIGLTIALFSYYILFLVNPELTILKSPNPTVETTQFEGFGFVFSDVDDGKECKDKDECQSGICWEFSDGVDDSKGNCIAFLNEGDICEDANIDEFGADDDIACPGSMICYDPGAGELGWCSNGLPQGATCTDFVEPSCGPGLVCNTSTTPDSCQPPGTVSEPCGDDLDCAEFLPDGTTRLFCNTGGGIVGGLLPNTCQPQQPEGGPCAETIHCLPGLTCQGVLVKTCEL